MKSEKMALDFVARGGRLVIEKRSTNRGESVCVDGFATKDGYTFTCEESFLLAENQYSLNPTLRLDIAVEMVVGQLLPYLSEGAINDASGTK